MATNTDEEMDTSPEPKVQLQHSTSGDMLEENQSKSQQDEAENAPDMTTSVLGLADMPEEILEHILCFLSPYRYMEAAKLVCHQWNRVIKSVVSQQRRNFYQCLYKCDVNWTEICKPLLPKISISDRFSHSTAYHDGILYVFGGCTSTSTTFNDLWTFDLTLRRWIRPVAMGTYPSPKACATMVVYNDNLVLFGGWCHPIPFPMHQSAHYFSELHMYSPANNRWTLIHSLGQWPEALGGHSASVAGHLMVVFGGSTRPGMGTNNLWVFNFKKSSWSLQPVCRESIPEPRYGQFQTTLDDNHILIMGGCVGQMRVYQDVWLLTLEPHGPWKWTKLTVENPQLAAPQTWCHAACKVDTMITVVAKSNTQRQTRKVKKPRRKQRRHPQHMLLESGVDKNASHSGACSASTQPTVVQERPTPGSTARANGRSGSPLSDHILHDTLILSSALTSASPFPTMSDIMAGRAPWPLIEDINMNAVINAAAHEGWNQETSSEDEHDEQANSQPHTGSSYASTDQQSLSVMASDKQTASCASTSNTLAQSISSSNSSNNTHSKPTTDNYHQTSSVSITSSAHTTSSVAGCSSAPLTMATTSSAPVTMTTTASSLLALQQRLHRECLNLPDPDNHHHNPRRQHGASTNSRRMSTGALSSDDDDDGMMPEGYFHRLQNRYMGGGGGGGGTERRDNHTDRGGDSPQPQTLPSSSQQPSTSSFSAHQSSTASSSTELSRRDASSAAAIVPQAGPSSLTSSSHSTQNDIASNQASASVPSNLSQYQQHEQHFNLPPPQHQQPQGNNHQHTPAHLHFLGNNTIYQPRTRSMPSVRPNAMLNRQRQLQALQRQEEILRSKSRALAAARVRQPPSEHHDSPQQGPLVPELGEGRGLVMQVDHHRTNAEPHNGQGGVGDVNRIDGNGEAVLLGFNREEEREMEGGADRKIPHKRASSQRKFSKDMEYNDDIGGDSESDEDNSSSPVLIPSKNKMDVHILDISAAVTEGRVEWRPLSEIQPPGAPEETICCSLVEGRGELMLFGGVRRDMTGAVGAVCNTAMSKLFILHP